MTALHVAAKCGKIDAVEWLLMEGAGVHANDADGFTPKACAKYGKHEEIRTYLEETEQSDKEGKRVARNQSRREKLRRASVRRQEQQKTEEGAAIAEEEAERLEEGRLRKSRWRKMRKSKRQSRWPKLWPPQPCSGRSPRTRQRKAPPLSKLPWPA